jgi:hypothetical protein
MSILPLGDGGVDREVRTRVIKRETRTIEGPVSPGSFTHSISEGFIPGESTTTYTRTLSGGPETGETVQVVRKERRTRRFLDEGKY